MLTAEDVLKVAALANLGLSGDEVAKMSSSLSDVLGHIDQLSRLDTGNVPPTSHFLEMGNVFRDDVVDEPFDHARSMENAPAKSRNYFSVPRIIE